MEWMVMSPGTRTIKRVLRVLALGMVLGCDSVTVDESRDVMPPEVTGVVLGMSRGQLSSGRELYNNSGDFTERAGSVSITYWFGDQLSGYDGGRALSAVVVSYPSTEDASSKMAELAARWSRLAGPPVRSTVKPVKSITGAAIPTRLTVWRHQRVQMALYEELQEDPGTHPPMRQLSAIVARSEVPLASLFAGFE